KSSRRSEAVRKFGRIIQTPESHSLSPSIQKSGNQGLRVYQYCAVKVVLGKVAKHSFGHWPCKRQVENAAHIADPAPN
ncbi:MAG: hypothetical protein KC448_12545, partial [Yoonia sp.]|nr:hypothetical protein [Yoonia sp.]